MDTEPTLPGAAPLEWAPVRAQGTPAEGRDALNEDSGVKKKTTLEWTVLQQESETARGWPDPMGARGAESGQRKDIHQTMTCAVW